MTRIYIGACAVLFCLVGTTQVGTTQAQGWRGIVPLHSTCEDVKRILKTSACERPFVELDDVTVFINFSDGSCNSEWRVAAGTVISLDVRPKNVLRLTDLGFDLTKYTRSVDPQVHSATYIKNEEEGVTITTFDDGRVRHLFYGPMSKDISLRCNSKTSTHGNGHGSVKIDEYELDRSKTETLRLDEFATTLAGWVGATGYIIVYPGTGVTTDQAQLYAAEAKTYLVTNKAIGKDRIVIVIGGFRDEPSVELFITVKNGDTPIPRPPARNPLDD